MIEKVTGRGEGCRPDPLFSQNRCPLTIGKDIDPSAGEPDEQQTAVVRQRTGKASVDVVGSDDLDDVSTFLGDSVESSTAPARERDRAIGGPDTAQNKVRAADQALFARL